MADCTVAQRREIIQIHLRYKKQQSKTSYELLDLSLNMYLMCIYFFFHVNVRNNGVPITSGFNLRDQILQ